MVLQAVPHPVKLTAITGGFEAEVFTVRMPFLSSKEHWQCTVQENAEDLRFT